MNNLFRMNDKYGADISKYLDEYDFENPKSHPQFSLNMMSGDYDLAKGFKKGVTKRNNEYEYEGEM